MSKQKELTEEQRETLEDSGRDIPEDVVLEYIDQTGDDDLSDLEESYEGTYDSDTEFAQTMAENVGDVNFSELHWPFTCIDWEYAAQELMMDYMEISHHYFRNL